MPPPTNNQAATTDQGTAYAEFGNEYDPQVQAVQTQEAQLGTDKNTALTQLSQDNTTKLSQLDQAKANAFSNNALTSNARGIMYSGYTPAQNTAYTTNTYNPSVQAQNTTYQRGVDSTNSTYDTNYQSLQDKITALNQQRANDANSLVQNTNQANATAAAAAAKAATSAANKSATTAASQPAVVQGSKGQYLFQNSAGKSINLQQYATQSGASVDDVLNLLKNGTSYDKSIYNKVAAAKPNGNAATINLIRELDTNKAYGF